MGWRKGADVDEELWPVEAFGGISDEQFWDDLASDKPLATTARTAQPAEAGNRASSLGGNPQATQPIPTTRPSVAAATSQLIPTAASGPQPMLVARPAATSGPQPMLVARPAATSGPQPMLTVRPTPAATQPTPAERSLPGGAPSDRAAGPAAGGEARGRGPARHGNRRSAEEDPLTSAAFALRASGPVDGRSLLTAGGSPGPAREQSADGAHRPGSGAPYAGASPYPAPERPYREPSSGPLRPSWPTNTSGPLGANRSSEANGASGTSWPYGAVHPASATPPYGESYALGGAQASSAAQAPGPSRPYNFRGSEPPYLNGNGQPYPGDTGYQGSAPPGGYPGVTYRRPHDPWSNGSRLSTTAVRCRGTAIPLGWAMPGAGRARRACPGVPVMPE